MHKIQAFAFRTAVALLAVSFILGCASDRSNTASDEHIPKQDGPKISFKWSDIQNHNAAKAALGKRYKKTLPAIPGKDWKDITEKLDWRTFDMDVSAGDIVVSEDDSGKGLETTKHREDKTVELYRKDRDGRTSLYAIFPGTGRFRMEADVYAKNIMSGALGHSGKFQIFYQEKGRDANFHEGAGHTGPDINESYIYHYRGWRRLRANFIQQDEEKQTVFRISLHFTSGMLKVANLRVFYQPLDAD